MTDADGTVTLAGRRVRVVDTKKPAVTFAVGGRGRRLSFGGNVVDPGGIARVRISFGDGSSRALRPGRRGYVAARQSTAGRVPSRCDWRRRTAAGTARWRSNGCGPGANLHIVKQGIHPDYTAVNVRCTCGNEFTTRSTQGDIHVEICSNCHPFYTGRQKLVDTGGRVERFQRRARRAAKPAPKTAAR